jgi:cardiolipin synthase
VWGTVGTTNFDNRSFAHNEETNVCFFDSDLACQLHGIFLDDVAACARVQRDAWARRGAWAKAQELVASFLQEQA